ncbi:MAG: endolytic transglycosylase MltG [Acidobacteriota bacterium]|nr:endolytic transglycosylase MltG [Acidobacteriota bacterium]
MTSHPSRRVRWLKRLALLLVLALVVFGAAGWWIYSRVNEPYRGYTGAEQFVDIPNGTGPVGIGQRLVDAGIVRDPWTFRAAVLISGRARELKAGEYRYDKPIDALEVIDKIRRGDIYRRLLTFREGLTIAEMAAVFEQKGFGSAAEFVQAASDPAAIRDLDPAARDLEGYLFPETYALPRGTSARDVVGSMVTGFKKAFDDELRAAAAADGLTVRQVVTLAALVEKETGTPDERPIVAAVYRNRMTMGMAMQADPTVIYALQKAGRYNGNLRREDLQLDSPYNTYRYPGLPPGPIASPGRASLQAAVRPAPVDYVYFVSKNDGTHAFATTLEEHNQNVFTWQVEYFRKQRQR